MDQIGRWNPVPTRQHFCKGQIVIPKEARDIFGIEPGDTLLLLGDEEQGIAIMKGDIVTELANKIFGAKEKEGGE
ncbi:AbrB/MazE/SpoVT family DNA-binding domain-containing protein [Paenibacillus thiaminolyticus]|uniref:AbrB/MazE/SpoVT family DNA-binding domain-containing protein n=1 Tax=Paenibacillus thiaminolyticus TaxID=49283 RepID=UPI0035A5974A